MLRCLYDIVISAIQIQSVAKVVDHTEYYIKISIVEYSNYYDI